MSRLDHLWFVSCNLDFAGKPVFPSLLKTVHLFFSIRNSMPFEFFITTFSLRFCTSAKSQLNAGRLHAKIRGVLHLLLHVADCKVVLFDASPAKCRCRPDVYPFSTIATFKPNCPARIAAT